MTRGLGPLSAGLLLLLSSRKGTAVLPGVPIKEYNDGDQVILKVKKLNSARTQLPYDFYELPFCEPKKKVNFDENLGEILTGDKILNSPYEIQMNRNIPDSISDPIRKVPSCPTGKKLDKKNLAKFYSMIKDEYVVEWIVDNLPVVQKLSSRGPDGTELLSTGFELGKPGAGGDEVILFNHVDLKLFWHDPSKDKKKPEADASNRKRIVGAEVTPRSVDLTHGGRSPDQPYTAEQVALGQVPPLVIKKDQETADVFFTYTVTWQENPDVRWATRWDPLLKTGDPPQIHWFSIVYSLMVVFFLSGMVAMILLRTLLRDIARYNDLDNVEEAQEESGWKLVHADVFRKPNYFTFLCTCVGSGTQIGGMLLITIGLSAIGLFSPAVRGTLLQGALMLFAFCGFPAGYVAARFCKLYAEDINVRSVKITLYTSLVFPGLAFFVFFMLNLALSYEGASNAVHFSTLFLLLVTWLGISTPLVFMGSYFGFRPEPISLPVRTNQIPRQIPAQSIITHPIITSLIGGLLPYGAAFTELFFIMQSVWHHQYYYFFGFLALTVIIVGITCAEISISFAYFQLVGEDYNWWWRSFMASATSGLHVFLYAILYFSNLKITRVVSSCLYFGYMFLFSTAFGLFTGAVGFISTFIFVRAIYGSIKID
uniref:Transmembrane 9 superfamily member n=1 Tax=Chromera velia CCMP2878 TaxID=1169474 RepID=A0A0G4GAR2_9ALVE|mmetsp:Transcript_22245/g.44119  ORF Transcript_22245/g.44119 Transcript_22245/m.44119 type:complete len:653 (-) Transcript_22245:58-2016(-)|eukprot:Cvel_21040.t1-p1 / transcript=Cvel_21040.t1 / gene=Cvel_21040 / organism=Chromera_velia_CCMP2878 / gene_product=Transmembrane 9 superfamily member 4, putative / transcript_product=Transmembrane 9 superfamily member 4, putative / location=Cvel_scaffold1942:558-10993(+) / protein_length=652 / sequence_SO=supercontig / SO=protein_coding / is_pseudo=false